jgi:predicted amidohydrolase
MPQPLSVAVVQPACVPLDVAANARAHARLIRLAAARVVVFPELSLTGYELDAPTIGVDDRRLIPMIEACAEMGTLALAGAPIDGAAGRFHIAMLAITGHGVDVAYRKLWLGDAESRRFSPGPGPVVIEVDGWRLGLAICKDTGVPRHQLDTAQLGIDAYVAGTAMFPDETEEQNARAARIAAEHRVWVAMASFAGPTGGGYTETAGSSGIWSPDGQAMAQADPQPGRVVRATLPLPAF